MTRIDSLTEHKRIRAWAGTVSDIRRLGQVIEAEFDSDREEEIKKATKGLRWRRLRLRLRRRSTDDIDSALRSFGRVHLHATNQHNETITDSLERVLEDEDIDLTGMESIALVCTVGDEQCLVSFEGEPLGSRMALTGAKRWVPAAARNIGHELDAKRPWWAILRHPAVYIALGVTLGVTAFAGLIELADAIDPDDKWSPTASSLFGIGIGIIPFALVWFCFRLGGRVFPAVELRSTDKPTTRQMVKRATAAVAGLFLGATAILQGAAWIVDKV